VVLQHEDTFPELYRMAIHHPGGAAAHPLRTVIIRSENMPIGESYHIRVSLIPNWPGAVYVGSPIAARAPSMQIIRIRSTACLARL
jgi:hypothetical protein